MTEQAYLAERRDDIHSESRWGQFRYVSRQLRIVIRDLVEAAELGPRARVFDYGCADGPYVNELPGDAEYVGADLPGNPNATVVLEPDGRVPLPAESFDLVLSTQVLEHVVDPELHLDECFRLLRPGGTLVLSTHGVMYYHRDPEDYWRWTRPGLERVVAARGFEVQDTRGVLALAAAALQIFQDATMWKVPRRLQPFYARGMNAAIAFVDGRYEEPTRVENCLTLATRATKPPA